MSASINGLIRAAGALLWRQTSGGYEIAVVHRRRYNDWTLPKGKLQAGESWRQAALREVREETGFNAHILSFAGAIGYEVDGKPKVVRFWHMTTKDETAAQIDDEVAGVFWFPLEDAASHLQYPLERSFLEVWQAPGMERQ